MDEVYNKLTQMSRHVNSKSPWLCENADTLDNTLLSDWLDGQVASMNLNEEQKTVLEAVLKLDFANNDAVPTCKQSLLAFWPWSKGVVVKNIGTCPRFSVVVKEMTYLHLRSKMPLKKKAEK